MPSKLASKLSERGCWGKARVRRQVPAAQRSGGKGREDGAPDNETTFSRCDLLPHFFAAHTQNTKVIN